MAQKKPNPGDLIVFYRPFYQHWAVYVGDGYVVHLASATDTAGAYGSVLRSTITEKAVVRKDKLQDVVGISHWKVNNRLDKKYKPRSGDIIVKKALAQVGKEVQYSVISGNCEHFATELRYGKAECRQVDIAAESGFIGIFVGALFIVGSMITSMLKN